MKIVALLSFYDEPHDFLKRIISTLPLAGVTDLIALDGRYALYPAEQTNSPDDQHETICEAARACDITVITHRATVPWPDEMTKRTHLFQLGEQITHPTDWYLIADADEEILTAPADVAEQLQASVLDVAGVSLQEPAHTSVLFPKFFRAIRGLHVYANHFTYRTPDGRYLWGNANTTRLEARHPISDMRVKHHIDSRPSERDEARKRYYRLRDDTGAEHQHPMVKT